MTTSTLVPLDEYLRTSYHPDRDWLSGELKERNMGDGLHATVQTFFIKYFAVHEPQWGIRVSQEYRTQVSDDHYRIPDVVVMRRSDPFEKIIRKAPLLCIEVLSPDDTMTDMQDKIDDYLAMGVAAVWVVDPRRRKCFQVQPDGALKPVAELNVPETAIRVAATEVFAELNALEAGSKD